MKEIKEIMQKALSRGHKNKITFLTGAGISSASGIPTYRGTDGIWIKGTKFYKPESFGTFEHFSKNADEVWQYTYFRKNMFVNAVPNQAHYKLVRIEQKLEDRFHIITQNIDNLHQRAGSERLYEIHGNLREMRCASECSKEVYNIPDDISVTAIDQELSYDENQRLTCPKCGDHTRPNILWFDEYYNERNFKLHSALKLAKNTSLLMILGSSGATNLPNQLVEKTLTSGGFVIDVNLEATHFSKNFASKKQFFSYRGDILEFLKLFEEEIKEHYA